MKINFDKLIGVDDSMDAPRVLMKTLYNKEHREKLFRKVQDASPDWSLDLFKDYFEQELAQRKVMKQDFTPYSVAKLASKLAGTGGRTLDVCSGTGSIVIAKWWNDLICSSIFKYTPSQFLYTCEELSDRALPFLLFNLLIRGVNAVVKHLDVLTRECKGVFFIQNDKDDYMQYSSLNLMPYTEEVEKFFGVKFTNFKHPNLIESPYVDHLPQEEPKKEKVEKQLTLF